MTNVYAVFDKLAQQVIGGLHLLANDAAAVRFFSDILQEPNSRLAGHPEDYELISLGELKYFGDRVSLQAASSIIVSATAVLSTLNAQKEPK